MKMVERLGDVLPAVCASADDMTSDEVLGAFALEAVARTVDALERIAHSQELLAIEQEKVGNAAVHGLVVQVRDR